MACNEYDDGEEYEQVLNELYSDAVFEVAKKAGRNRFCI